MCNIWQGKFPEKNHVSDGYAGTAPVHSFESNGYGLYNVVGNVWEWCSDWFSSEAATRGNSANPQGPKHGTHKVMRGVLTCVTAPTVIDIGWSLAVPIHRTAQLEISDFAVWPTISRDPLTEIRSYI